jgi:hypothetical protein
MFIAVPVLNVVPTDTVPVPGVAGVGNEVPLPPVADTAGPKLDVPPGEPVPPVGTALPAPPPTTVTLTCVADAGFVQVPGVVNNSVRN